MSERVNTFWSLLRESVIVQSLVTAAVIGIDLYLYVTVGALPDGLDRLTYIVVSFWMGSKVQHAADTAARKRRG